jgi:hypothetical protein
MKRHLDPPAELVPDIMAQPFHPGRAQKNMPRKMDQVSRNAPPPVTGQEQRNDYDRTAAKVGDHVPAEEVRGPAIIPQPREKGRKRERPGLTPGMRTRLLSMISRARSSSAAARAHLDRRHELMTDLVAAQQRARKLSDEFERTRWARSQDGGRSRDQTEAQKSVARELERVESLKAEIARLDQLAHEAVQRSSQMRTMAQKIGRRYSMRKGSVVWGEIDEADIDALEENLIGN